MIGVTTEEIMRRLVAMERAYSGRPPNERAHRRRHVTRQRPLKKIPFTNISGEAMPAHAVGLVTGISSGTLQVDKFTIANVATVDRIECVINLGTDAVPDTEDGKCVYLRDITPEHPVRALYYWDSVNSPVPAYSEVWGPLFDQWSIVRGAPGVVILGDVDTTNKLVTVKAQDDGDTEFLCRYSSSGTAATIAEHSVLHGVGAVAGTSTTMPYEEGKDTGATHAQVHNNLPVFTGPVTVAKTAAGNGYFQGELGIAKPIIARVASSSGSAHGAAAMQIVGPVSGKTELYLGIPGYAVLGVVTGDFAKCVVIRDPRRLGWCKVTSDWAYSGSGATETATFTARPCTDATGATVYDGSASHLPAVSFTVTVNTYGHYSPIVRQDDVLAYRFDGNDKIYPVGEVLGARLRTVCLWTVSGTVAPRNWAIMNGTDNSVGNGGSGFDMRSRFPVGHDTAALPYDSLGEAGTFGDTGTTYLYRALPFIERIK